MTAPAELRRWSDSPLYAIARRDVRCACTGTLLHLIRTCLGRIAKADPGTPCGRTDLLFWEIRLEALTDEVMERTAPDLSVPTNT